MTAGPVTQLMQTESSITTFLLNSFDTTQMTFVSLLLIPLWICLGSWIVRFLSERCSLTEMTNPEFLWRLQFLEHGLLVTDLFRLGGIKHSTGGLKCLHSLRDIYGNTALHGVAETMDVSNDLDTLLKEDPHFEDLLKHKNFGAMV